MGTNYACTDDVYVMLTVSLASAVRPARSCYHYGEQMDQRRTPLIAL